MASATFASDFTIAARLGYDSDSSHDVQILAEF
jgi:hypothetical protein